MEAPEIIEESILKEWGWPQEPFEEEELQRYVRKATKSTQQEEYNSAVSESAPENQNVYLNKQFANVFLEDENAGEDLASQKVDANSYKAGTWYSFLNAKGDCRVYVHNYTRDLTFVRPSNFVELPNCSTKSFAPLGTYIEDLPAKLDSVYCHQKSIPLVLASQETCENLKTYFAYHGVLCDSTKLKRINAKALEECRCAIVNAMKFGKWLCVYMGDNIVDFKDKVCVSKNKRSFPSAVFKYGGLEIANVKEQLYVQQDMESGQCIVRPGFKVCLVVTYDSMKFDMSSFGREAMKSIPFLGEMQEVRAYNADDRKRYFFDTDK